MSNDVRILSSYLMKERSCTLDWRAYTYYFTCETDDYDLIELQIPAHAELVLGLDKKELQEALDPFFVNLVLLLLILILPTL